MGHPVIAVEGNNFCEEDPWTLVFSDEFEGDSLDTATWLRHYPYCESGDDCLESRTHNWPKEMQVYLDENVRMTGQGTVQIIARRDTIHRWHSAASLYTSGMLHSRHQFGRGRFESRLRVPYSTSKYLWPAFWLFGGEGPCSEIDILEITANPSTKYHHALHRYNWYCDEKHASEEGSLDLNDLSDDFHVYRVDWDKWFVDFYIDGKFVHRSCRMYDLSGRPVSTCEIPTGIYVQNQAFPAQDARLSIILNLALSEGPYIHALGGIGSIPDLPAIMEVDYVRVYTR